jgi:choline dehydrogenase
MTVANDILPQTPALLQLSGIGDSDLLGSLGITTLIDLKTVGRNLQEQVSLTCAPCE